MLLAEVAAAACVAAVPPCHPFDAAGIGAFNTSLSRMGGAAVWPGEGCGCGMLGIACNTAGRITAIDLHNQQLAGAIPEAIASLDHLEQ